MQDPALIISTGSSLIKAGWSGEYNPEVCFPSVVGRPKPKSGDTSKIYVGKDAIAKRCTLDIIYPFTTRDIVNNWDDVTTLQDYTYNELKFRHPSESPVFLTEAAGNLDSNREKITEIFFEKFQVPAFYICQENLLVIYANGRTTGLV